MKKLNSINKKNFNKGLIVAATIVMAGLNGCQQFSGNYKPTKTEITASDEIKVDKQPTIKEKQTDNYEYSVKQLGGEDSSYSIYQFDTPLTGDIQADHACYLKKYKTYVRALLKDFSISIQDEDEVTKKFFARYIDNINYSLETDDIYQVLRCVHDSGAYVYANAIQYTPSSTTRVLLSKLTPIVLFQSYKDGFPDKNSVMESNYKALINAASIWTYSYGWWPFDKDTLKEDIENNNCKLIIATYDKKLTEGIQYLNKAKGTNVKLKHLQKITNISATALSAEAMLEYTLEKEVFLSCKLQQVIDKAMEHNPKLQTWDQDKNLSN